MEQLNQTKEVVGTKTFGPGFWRIGERAFCLSIPSRLGRIGLKGNRGVALLLVLGSLVLLSALTLAFLGSVSTELLSSKSYATGTSVRLLSDTALNMIIGQIRDASTQTNIGWASQPGLIRTFGGSSDTAYKLYSSPEMRLPAGSYDPLADIPSTWSNNPELYTDLNAPVTTRSQDPVTKLSTNVTIYPILDPRATNQVDGFSIPTGTRMPVRWLYVLKDGQITTADKATKDNPITARMAFWTDDESCKININTASEGNFWDIPAAESNYERTNFGWDQPANNEFQRYPGHPATTSLSVVFTNLNYLGTNFFTNIYELVPRIVHGGAAGSDWGNQKAQNGFFITNDSDRLYATADELVFATNRLRNKIGSLFLTNDAVSRIKFFITANSRAPEVNLFNQPRVTIWPIPAVSTKRTPFDKLMIFCSTVGKTNYYFQRDQAASPTADWTSYSRNQQIYSYLSNLMCRPVPGFGSLTFKDKYQSDQPQILTEIFDYIRIVNARDPYWNSTTANMFAGTLLNSGVPAASTVGQITPIQINNTRGFGRFSTISEVALQFYTSAATTNTSPPPTMVASNINCVVLVELDCPSRGYTDFQDNLEVDVNGLNTAGKFLVNGTKLVYAKTNIFFDKTGFTPEVSTLGGGRGFTMSMFKISGAYNLISGPINVPKTNFFSFQGGDLQLLVRRGTTVIQTNNVFFPDGTFPMPRYTASTNAVNSLSYSTRIGASPTSSTLISTNDTIRSVESASGDTRLHFLQNIPSNRFRPHKDYFATNYFAHGLYCSGYSQSGGVPRGATYGNFLPNILVSNLNYSTDRPRVGLPSWMYSIGATNVLGKKGDWDTGCGLFADGPYINKPDQGVFGTNFLIAQAPYFHEPGGSVTNIVTSSAFFSPNRQVPSPAAFGSLPTGAQRGYPWQTLLFHPETSANHPGAADPKDHLLLDLFNMPVVEPYAISEPFSTAGKINMNYQIYPFTNIVRSTGMRAVLKAMRITAIGDTMNGNYKVDCTVGASPQPINKPWQYRKALDLDQTLSQLDQRFATNGFFKSASEICDVEFVPVGLTVAGMASFWSTNRLTGDNLRERPYSNVYPRITTKSNVYTVHLRVQTLLKNKNDSAQNVWKENIDTVTGDYRGSYIIERYLDPNLSSYNENNGPLTGYKFRVVSAKQFAP